jgi:hypothetical protein
MHVFASDGRSVGIYHASPTVRIVYATRVGNLSVT